MKKGTKVVTINYDAPAEIHKAVRGKKDDVFIDEGERKRIPDIYQELIAYALQCIRPGDEIKIPEFASDRRIRTIFYISNYHRQIIDDMFNPPKESDTYTTLEQKLDIMLAYSLLNLYGMNVYGNS